MRKRLSVWRALLLAGALTAAVWLFYEYQAVLVFFKTFSTWCLHAGRFAGVFLKRIIVEAFRTFLFGKFMRPLWAGIGLTWLTTYAARHAQRTIGPRITQWGTQTVEWWRVLPWYFKTATVLAVMAVAVFFSLGLWLIPFGIPFLGKMVAKAKVAWANSWLRQKTRSIRMRVRLWMRRHRANRCIRVVRGCRYYLICRDRSWNARADEFVEKVTGEAEPSGP